MSTNEPPIHDAEHTWSPAAANRGAVVVHHAGLLELLKPSYSPADLSAIEALLVRSGTFAFPAFETGLFPAVPTAVESSSRSGYRSVWIRDNVHVAHALFVAGERDAAARCARSLARFALRSVPRMRRIAEQPERAQDPLERPHVRFDGTTLEELDERWTHAQNDALGALLWLFCRMLDAGLLAPEEGDDAWTATLCRYLAAIRYWEDEDCGHWEETRKLSASSIGVVVAGLEALLDSREPPFRPGQRGAPTHASLRRLVAAGRAALDRTLPHECVQDDAARRRRHDAALLFLAQPFDVLSPEMESTVVDETLEHLEGTHGIRRYRGDSYWAPDYEKHLRNEHGCDDHAQTASWRDRLASAGREAQWCLFDPVVSTIFGRRYLRSRAPEDLELQVRHFQRALGQLTGEGSPHGELRCPESYYLRAGRYVPNEQTPLLWTQANLRVALEAMKRSVAEAAARR